MSLKTYFLQFGSGNPQSFAGLSPTFTIFNVMPGATAVAAPPITEIGISVGIYTFQYDMSTCPLGQTFAIIFQADGGALLTVSDRFIVGALDPIQSIDQRLGYQADSFGGASLGDPNTVFGHEKRTLEMLEGDKNFAKSTGVWTNYARDSTTLLVSKQLANTSTIASSS